MGIKVKSQGRVEESWKNSLDRYEYLQAVQLYRMKAQLYVSRSGFGNFARVNQTDVNHGQQKSIE
jgi:hypothetical protein